MPSRHILTGILRIVGMAALVILLFAATALAVGLPAAWLRNVPLGSTPGIFLAVICGLIVWLFVAVFLFKRETVQVAMHHRESFVAGLKQQMQGLGYHLETESASDLAFKPAFHSYRFGGAIQVHLEDHGARIVGPKVYVEQLRSGFRLQSHLDKVSQAMRERPTSSNGQPGRVQITLHVPSEHWRHIYQQAIELLECQGLEKDVTVLEETASVRNIKAAMS